MIDGAMSMRIIKQIDRDLYLLVGLYIKNAFIFSPKTGWLLFLNIKCYLSCDYFIMQQLLQTWNITFLLCERKVSLHFHFILL